MLAVENCIKISKHKKKPHNSDDSIIKNCNINFNSGNIKKCNSINITNMNINSESSSQTRSRFFEGIQNLSECNNNKQLNKVTNGKMIAVKPRYVRVINVHKFNTDHIISNDLTHDEQCVVIPSPAQLNQMISKMDFQVTRYSSPAGPVTNSPHYLNTTSPVLYHSESSSTISGSVGVGAVSNTVSNAINQRGVAPNYQPQNMRLPTLVSPVPIAQLPVLPQQQILRTQDMQLQQPTNVPPSAVIGRHLPVANANQLYHAHQSPPGVPVPLHQIRVANNFCGIESQGAMRYSPELCLAGCVFLLLDDYLPTEIDRNAMCAAIRFYGGDIEIQSPRGIPERVTHVVCNTVAHNDIVIYQALNDRRKRIVTFQWLNEAIMKKRIEAPTKACHLPTCWNENNRPALGKIISIAGFDPIETTNFKSMIRLIGAKFTPNLTSELNILIVKNADCKEIEKAKLFDTSVHIVNYQWLVEIYFGNVQPLNDFENVNYSPMNNSPHFKVSVSTYTLERISEFCQKLLYSWKFPIFLNDEIIDKAVELKKNVEHDPDILSYRTVKCFGEPPTEEQILEANEILRSFANAPNDIFVHFEGLLPEQIDHLSRKLRFLGGEVVNSVEACSHFVTPNLERTAKCVEALALGKNIVSPDWILQSFSMLKLVDVLDFFVHDPFHERQYGFNLKNTILLARHRKVFEDVTFHLSPSVVPSLSILIHLITAAGGTIERERPKRKRLAECITNDDTYFVIVNENDLDLYHYLIFCNFPLFTEEFVLMAILRHEIDTTSSTSFRVPIPGSLQLLKMTQVTTAGGDSGDAKSNLSRNIANTSKNAVKELQLAKTSIPQHNPSSTIQVPRQERIVKAS